MVEANGLYVVDNRVHISYIGDWFARVSEHTRLHKCGHTKHGDYLDAGWSWIGPKELVKW